MNLTTPMPIHRLFLGCSALALALTLAPAAAVEVATVPEGYVKLTVAAGATNAPVITLLSFPLLSPPSNMGAVEAAITSVTSNTLSKTDAGWTAGAFATAAQPYWVRILGGSATGRTFKITGNTVDTLTLDTAGTDLTTLGIVTGTDKYVIFPGETLLTAFGTPASGTPIVGGTSANTNTVDTLLLLDSAGWKTYYFNTTNNRWQRSGLPIASNDVPISPNSGVIYSRVSTTFDLVLMGRVPTTNAKYEVGQFTSFLSAPFPVDQTLQSLGIQSMPGWRKVGDAGVTAADADQVMLMVSGLWRRYYYDSTFSGGSWRRVGLGQASNSQPVPAGSALLLARQGSGGTGTADLPIPYALN